jgi:hypothetical protein
MTAPDEPLVLIFPLATVGISHAPTRSLSTL